MPKHLLSDRKVLNAKPRDKEYLLSDGEGLALRVRPDGSRLWLFRYTSLAGRPAKKSVGVYPRVTLADARQKTALLRRSLLGGIDPASKVEGKPITVDQLFDVWVRDSLSSRRNAQGVYAATRRMKRNVSPHVGRDKLGALTKPRILELLAPIVAAGHGPQANCVLIDLKQMLDFALQRSWIPTNPASLINKAAVGGKDVVCERVLSETEIVLLRDQMQQPNGLRISGYAAFWIALSTMTRAGEIASVQDFEIDWVAREWNLPAAKNKSNRDHIIHLSPFAFHWLTIMRAQPRPSTYLFPGKAGVGHVGYDAFSHQATIRQDSKSTLQGLTVRGTLSLPGGRWTMHDLRRTGATIMGELGVSENVIEKCLNHAEQSRLVKVYQRQKLLAQRREAFDMLGEHLTKLLGDPNIWGPVQMTPPRGSNVVAFKRA